MRRTISITIFITLLATGLASAQPPVSFVNTVAVGDSLAAGFQSGVLRQEGQIASFPAVIARQIGTFMFLPLMPAPGVGAEIMLVNGDLVQGPTTGGAASRGFPLIVPQNLAVPGQTTLDALTVRPDLRSPDLSLAFPNLILGVPFTAVFMFPPVSQIELAVGLQPTFTILWLGSNEVLGKALFNGPATPIQVFQNSYLNAVGALLTFTDTRLVVANVPDVTVVPFLTSAEEVAAGAGAPIEAIGPVLGIGPGDFVRAPFIGLIPQILTGQVPGPLPAGAVLTAAEVGELKLLTAQMNGFIAGVGAQLGFPVVDANTLLNDVDLNGIEVGGQTLTTNFLGGLFTLDGFHPTNTAHAIVANAYIDAINGFYGTAIPPADVAAVAAADPLVFPQGPGAQPPQRMALSPQAADSLREILIGPDLERDHDGLNPGRDPEWGGELTLQDLDTFLNGFRYITVRPGPANLPGADRKANPGGKGMRRQ